jgi:GT2 family glycosyltransferase
MGNCLIPGNTHFPLLKFYRENPGYEHYWVIEDDVRFSGDWALFFESFLTIPSDFITCNIRYWKEDPYWYWWNLKHPSKKVPLEKRLSSLNPIYRISNIALKFINMVLLDGWCGHHEVLLPTLLKYGGYQIADFAGNGKFVSPDIKTQFYSSDKSGMGNILNYTMRSRPTFNTIGTELNKLYHPVKDFYTEEEASNIAQPVVYSVVVTYNAEKFIDWCISSLVQSTLETRIIVVDNNSTDQTVCLIQSKYPDIILIKNNENMGFGRANNIGFSMALKKNADFIFLLNQDARIRPDTISELIRISLNNLDYGIISPIHYNGNGNRLDRNFANYINEYSCPGFLSDRLEGNHEKEIYRTTFVNAACWLIPVKTIETVGGFSPLYFMYREDDEFIRRCTFHKLKVGITPKAFIYHARINTHYRKRSFWDNMVFAGKETRQAYRDEFVNIFGQSNVIFRKRILQQFWNNFIIALFNFRLLPALIHLAIFFLFLYEIPKLLAIRNEIKRPGAIFLNE